MALVLPPDVAYDSFVSLVDAQTHIDALTLDGTTWSAIDSATRETYLRIATRRIQDGIDPAVYVLDPAAIPECLAEATSLIAVHDLVNGISASSTTVSDTGAIRKEQVGSIVQEYYDTKSSTDGYTALIPTLAMPCLESVGYVFPSGLDGVRQVTLGRS